MQIFVLGMHRSGASALAGLLSLMGVGYHSRRTAVAGLLNDTILFSAGCDWDRVSHFDLEMPDSRNVFEETAADIVLNMDARRPWFLNDPRLCLLFPLWRPALETPVCIHIVRNPLEVAHSLKAREAIPIRAGLALWEFYNIRALTGSASLPRIFVGYEELLLAPERTGDWIHAALSAKGVNGLRRPDQRELYKLLDPALRTHRKSRRALQATATASQLELYSLLKGATDSPATPSPELSEGTLDTLRAYERTVDANRQAIPSNVRSGTLAELKSRIAGLSRMERQLRKEISILLGSRRWRIGDAVFELGNRVLMRRTRNAIPGRLSNALAHYCPHRRIFRNLANRLDISIAPSSESTPPVRQQRDAPSTPQTALPAASQKQRTLRFTLYEREAVELGHHVERLVSLGEALLLSRRWRFGAWLASARHRLVLRSPPLTTADSLSRHIRNYRFDKATARAGHSINARQPLSEARLPFPTQSAEPFPESASVDIVVCVHNALNDVQRCLHSIAAKTTVDYRLFAINNGSDEETTRWLHRFAAGQPDTEIIDTHGPLGYTRAANRGLRAAGAQFVVLLNSDTVVPRLWLEALLECITSDEKIGIAGPVSNAATWQSIPETLNEQGGWAVNSLPPGYNVDEFSELIRLKSTREFPRVDLVNGFCLMISRQVIERIGYLDAESFPGGYGEENDYCLRARNAGIELAIADHCFVYHAKSKRVGSVTRDSLAAQGRKTLEARYGIERIRHGTELLRNSPVLANLRRAVAKGLAATGTAVVSGSSGKTRESRSNGATPGNVLFVMPVKGGSGGANSVIQEVAGMNVLGTEARVATHERYRDGFRHFYREHYDAGNLFVFFDSDADLMALSEPFDIIVATLWSTPAQIVPIARRRPHKVIIYYVQDYEPWFFPHDPDLQSEAAESYTLIRNMALMAKTDWICRTVRERHGKEVYRVTPSLDHQVYFAASRQKKLAEGVTIAAMIRPSTPRRAPLRTLQVIREATARSQTPVRVVIFGCESPDLHAHLKRHAPDLCLDFPVENRGLLTRVQVADLLREADIFLDLSDYQAFGRTGLEAMACGCATVLTAHGGSYEYALDGENCLLVDVTSAEETAAAIDRLIDDCELRQRIQSNAIETAAGYSVLRASLSELSVFRLVSSLRRRGRQAAAISYRRAVEPAVAGPVPVSLCVLAPSGTITLRRPFSGLQSRILRPLRHASLRDRLRVRESLSLKSLSEQQPDICVVAGESIEEVSMARGLVELCRESDTRLIYETDEPPGARGNAEAAVRLLATAADRVIVSSGSLCKAYSGLNSAVKVLPAAIDEELWVERSISGERLLGERRSPHAIRLVSLSEGTGLSKLARHWPEIRDAASKTVSLQVFGGFNGSPGSGWEIMPELDGDLEDSVTRLRAANRWDIALLPANRSTPDADLQFLAYAALGLTILCSDQGSHMQFARHAKNAIVVGSSPTDWRAAIKRSIDDADLREALSSRALYDVDTRHSLKRRALDFYAAYCEGIM